MNTGGSYTTDDKGETVLVRQTKPAEVKKRAPAGTKPAAKPAEKPATKRD